MGETVVIRKAYRQIENFICWYAFFMHSREKIQVITSDCAVCLNTSVKDVDDPADKRGEREHPVLFFNRVQRADYEILSFAETRFPL